MNPAYFLAVAFLVAASQPTAPQFRRHSGIPPQVSCPPFSTAINESFADLNNTTEGCMLLPGKKCIENPPLCPSSVCHGCQCHFNPHACSDSNYCSQARFNLGISCSDSGDPIKFILEYINSTSANKELARCLSDRVCGCLSRSVENNNIIEIENHCYSLCVGPNDTNAQANSTGLMAGNQSKNEDQCNIVNRHYCRRHTKATRTKQCAQQCILDNSCAHLIEGILEGEYEGNDVDAAIALMGEFQTGRAHRLHSRHILQAQKSFFQVIENDTFAFISHLNSNNTEDLISLIDDLLADERQNEWMELLEEQESPGEEVLERIETAAQLLGMSRQLASMFPGNFEFVGNSIAADLECQERGRSYQHIFNRVLNGSKEEAALSIPPLNSDSETGCARVITAVLSSNLGQYLENGTNDQTVVSEVMTVQVIDGVQTNPIPYLLLTFFSLGNKSLDNIQCVFWNSTLRKWSTYGVELVSVNETDSGTFYTCNSSHLSSFAVLTSTKPLSISAEEATALSFITYIGCGISILSLLLTIGFLLAFRKSLNKGVLLYIHLNLFLALLLALVLFVSALETATSIKWLCATVAALLHYLFLSVFCWMLAEGIALYALIIRPFATNFKKWCFLLLLGWGLPVPIVAISVGIRHKYYGNDQYCWLTHNEGLVASFIAPMLAIIAINTIILILTVVSIIRVQSEASKGNENKHKDIVKVTIKSTVILLPLLGITWIIGVFALDRNTTAFAWAFTILNSLQGLMIFVLHVLRSKILWSELRKRLEGFGISSLAEFTSAGKGSTLPRDHKHHSEDDSCKK